MEKITDENYMEKLFINEAKAALDSKGAGGGSASNPNVKTAILTRTLHPNPNSGVCDIMMAYQVGSGVAVGKKILSARAELLSTDDTIVTHCHVNVGYNPDPITNDYARALSIAVYNTSTTNPTVPVKVIVEYEV